MRQGCPPQTSTTAPFGDRNVDFWLRAATVLRGKACGSSPPRFGMLSAGAGGVCGPPSQYTIAEPWNGKLPMLGIPNSGVLSVERPAATAGRYAEAPIVRASTSDMTLATWWSPTATCRSTVCFGVFRGGLFVTW